MAICAVTFLLYVPSLKGQFLSNDDNLHVYDNPAVRALDAKHLKQIFTTTTNLPTYIPLTTLSFALEYHFVQNRPFLYHLDNVLLHVAVTALIFYLALLLGLPLRAAFVAGLLFGIHPMHVESVAWVTERKDVLYSLFYMLALCCYWKYLNERKPIFYVATIFLGILSVLAKPMALSLPLIMWLLDWYRGRRFNKWMILDKIPHFAYIGAIALVTYVMNARIPVQHAGEALLFWVWCSVFYLWKFIWPVDLILFNRFPEPFTLQNPQYFLSFVLLGALIYALWRYRKHKLFVFAFLFYFLSIFFLFRFDDIKYLPPVSSRFMYLPSVGICFLLGYGVDLVFKKLVIKNGEEAFILTICLMIVAVMLSVKTFAQIYVWRANIPFWSHELKYDPQNAFALVNRGEAYKDSGRFDLAMADFQNAVKADPNYAEGYNSRGLLYGMSGQADAALADFQKTIELKPHYDEAYNNLGIVYSLKGDLDSAVGYFNKALQLDPLNTQAYFNLGQYYFGQGDLERAFEHFQKLLSIDPHSSLGHSKRGLIYGIRQRDDLAMADFNRALLLDPHNSEAYSGRGIILEHQGRIPEAYENYNKAIQWNPDNADAYYGRGNVFAQTKQYQSAARDYKKALEINPRHAGAQKNQQALSEIMSKQQKPKNTSP